MEDASRCDRAATQDGPGRNPAYLCVHCNEHRLGVSTITANGRICRLCQLSVSVQFHPEDDAMRGFRIATCAFLLGATLSCLCRPVNGQDLSLVAAAVEAEACKPSVTLDECPTPSLDKFVETAKPPASRRVGDLTQGRWEEVCSGGQCEPVWVWNAPPATCTNGKCSSGEACPCETCDCTDGDCCTPATAARESESIVKHRGHVFDGEAKFMERGPGRRLVGRVFGRVREAVANRPRLLRRAIGAVRGCRRCSH